MGRWKRIDARDDDGDGGAFGYLPEVSDGAGGGGDGRPDGGDGLAGEPARGVDGRRCGRAAGRRTPWPFTSPEEVAAIWTYVANLGCAYGVAALLASWEGPFAKVIRMIAYDAHPILDACVAWAALVGCLTAIILADRPARESTPRVIAATALALAGITLTVAGAASYLYATRLDFPIIY